MRVCSGCGSDKPTVVSLFDGIGGFPLAFTRAGYRVVALVEIDAAAAGVAAEHFPDAVHFADVTKVTADELITAGFCPVCGIVCAGFPCQDLSLAGRRAGLDGARSGLFFEIVRIVAGLRCRWLVLENVPGLLSSVCPCVGDNACGGGCTTAHTVRGGACGPGRCVEIHGGAMGAVLGAVAQLGYGFAYRVLDAQHFGVPQRRRRVFVVGCLGDGRAPAEVLLEPDGSERDSAARDPARSRAARSADVGARGVGSAVNSLTTGSVSKYDDNSAQGGHLIPDVAPTLQGGGKRGYRIDAEMAAGGGLITAGAVTAKSGGADENDAAVNLLVPHTATPLTAREGKGPDSDLTSGNIVATVTAKWAKGSGGPAGDETQNLIGVDLAQITHPDNRANPKPGDPQPALNATSQPAVAYQGHGTNVGPMGTLRAGSGTVAGGVPFTATGEVTHALTSEGADASEDGTGRGTPVIAFGISSDAVDRTGEGDGSAGQRAGLGILPDASPSLRARSNNSVATHAAVRRLTPVECERLQGYSDGWTARAAKLELVDNRWKRAGDARVTDSPRYRQLGNSVAVPVVEWIARRMALADR